VGRSRVYMLAAQHPRHKCIDHVPRHAREARKSQGRVSIDYHGLMEPFDPDQKAWNILEMVHLA
jgi:hypothetical protein